MRTEIKAVIKTNPNAKALIMLACAILLLIAAPTDSQTVSNTSDEVFISWNVTTDVSDFAGGSAANYGWNNSSNWNYRRMVNLSSATTAAHYQVLINLTTAVMGSPYSHVNTNGSDIRFSNADGTIQMDYWIESWDNNGTSKIWVEVPTSGTSTIYMYYGNAGAAPASSGDNTFLFFDDFPGGSIDLTKWTPLAPSPGGDAVASVSGGVLHQYALSGYHWLGTNPVPLPNNIIIEHKMKIGTYADAVSKNRNRFFIGGADPFDKGIFDDWRGGGKPTTISYYWNGYGSPIINTTLNTWLRNVNKIHGSTLEWAVSIYSTGLSEYSKSTAVTVTTPLKYYISVGDYGCPPCATLNWGGDIYTDWVFIRKYASTEPSTIAGSEESISVRAVSLTNITALELSTSAGTNATYFLNLTNNGTGQDTYTMNISNPDGAGTAALNITSPVFLNAGASQIFSLNVINTSSGIFRVNVTATSDNDPTKFAYINTTTNVTATPPTSTNITIEDWDDPTGGYADYINYVGFSYGTQWNIALWNASTNALSYQLNGTIGAMEENSWKVYLGNRPSSQEGMSDQRCIYPGTYNVTADAGTKTKNGSITLTESETCQSPIAPIPELSTIVLMSAGLIGLLGLVRLWKNEK